MNQGAPWGVNRWAVECRRGCRPASWIDVALGNALKLACVHGSSVNGNSTNLGDQAPLRPRCRRVGGKERAALIVRLQHWSHA